jgi:Mor family transcriptional regulator
MSLGREFQSMLTRLRGFPVDDKPEEPVAPNKYWSAQYDKESEAIAWVGSEYRPDWRKRVVGGDRRKRPNGRSGSTNPLSKLTESDIPVIHIAYRNGDSICDLSKKYGMSRATIYSILQCKTWAHVWDEGPSMRSRRASILINGFAKHAKLTVENINEIRNSARNGASRQSIGKKLGVSSTLIRQILRGEVWKHVLDSDTRPMPEGAKKGELRPMSKLNPEKVREIRDLAKSGHNQTVIATTYGVCQAIISRIIHRKAWVHVPDEPEA